MTQGDKFRSTLTDVAQRRIDPLERRIFYRLSPAAADNERVAAVSIDDSCNAGQSIGVDTGCWLELPFLRMLRSAHG